jgi:serine/threonine-protein kinase
VSPSGKRLTSPGGAVYAACVKGKAALGSPEPATGYSVQRIDEGPALAPAIVFKGATNRYRISVTCVAGEPAPVVLPL